MMKQVSSYLLCHQNGQAIGFEGQKLKMLSSINSPYTLKCLQGVFFCYISKGYFLIFVALNVPFWVTCLSLLQANHSTTLALLQRIAMPLQLSKYLP